MMASNREFNYPRIEKNMTRDEKIKISIEKIVNKSEGHIRCQSAEERRDRRRQANMRSRYRKIYEKDQIIAQLTQTINQLSQKVERPQILSDQKTDQNIDTESKA